VGLLSQAQEAVYLKAAADGKSSALLARQGSAVHELHGSWHTLPCLRTHLPIPS
jgi:hypothetical protein